MNRTSMICPRLAEPAGDLEPYQAELFVLASRVCKQMGALDHERDWEEVLDVLCKSPEVLARLGAPAPPRHLRLV